MGPLLFLLYINDLDSAISLDDLVFVLFADDLAICHSDIEKLQCVLNLLSDYLEKSDLILSVKKTKFMTFVKTHNKLDFSQFTLQFKDEEIEEVKRFKYLGVFLNTNMNFELHIKQIDMKNLLHTCGRDHHAPLHWKRPT